MRLFSGTANTQLAKHVGRLLGVDTHICEVVQFGNSELRVRIVEDVTDETCVVIQSTSNPVNNHVIELLLIADALGRGGAKKIHAIIPYFGYSRQHVQFRTGEAVSANVMTKIFKSVGISSIITIDQHHELQNSLLPINNLSAMLVLAETMKPLIKNSAVISPDEGGKKRAEEFARLFYNKEKLQVTYITKRRSKDKIHMASAEKLNGEVKGKTVIIVDDIITSGLTLTSAANLCKKFGATHILAAVTHADFLTSTISTIVGSPIEHIYITDTIKHKTSKLPNKFTTISIAPMIAKRLKKLLQ